MYLERSRLRAIEQNNSRHEVNATGPPVREVKQFFASAEERSWLLVDRDGAHHPWMDRLTVVPAVTFSGLLPNAFVPRPAAPEGITTIDAGPPAVVSAVTVPGLLPNAFVPGAAAPEGVTTIDAGPPADGVGVGDIGLCDVL
jgi:hypothetical protein